MSAFYSPLLSEWHLHQTSVPPLGSEWHPWLFPQYSHTVNEILTILPLTYPLRHFTSFAILTLF